MKCAFFNIKIRGGGCLTALTSSVPVEEYFILLLKKKQTMLIA